MTQKTAATELLAESLSKSVTRRVLLLSLVGFLGLTSTITIGLLSTLDDVYDHLNQLDSKAFGVFDRFFLDIKSDLSSTADGFSARNDKSSALLRVISRNKSILDAVYVGPDGAIQAQKNAVGRSKLTKAEHPPWLKPLAPIGTVAIGPVLFEGGSPYVDMAVEATDDINLPSGFLLARVDLTSLWNSTLDIRVGKTGYAYIADDVGQIVGFRNRMVLGSAGRLQGPLENSPHLATGILPYYRSSLTGVLVLGSAQRLSTVPWYAIVEQPLHEALEPLVLPGLLLLAAFVVVVALNYDMVRFTRIRVVGPLRAMREAVGEMAGGQLNQSVKVWHNDELGQLGHSFNRMAGQLQQSFVDQEGQIEALLKAKAALLASETNFKRMLDNLPLPVAMAAKDGVIAFRNERFIRVFGYSADAAPTIAEWYLLAYPDPHYRKKVLALWDEAVRRAIEAGHDVEPLEYNVTCKNCDVRSMVISGITLGESLLVTFIDLTERKKLEDQLRQAQKMEAIGQLAGGVAHDFNNILAAILLQLDFLKQDFDLKAEVLAGLEEIKNEAKRAANLTRQLLLFSRRSTLETKVLDINEVVANLLKMLGRLLGENVTLVFERRNNLNPIEADAGMLDQVLVNLAVNARDSMPKGGRITLAAEAIEMDNRMAVVNPDRRPGRFVRISISDEGCGMDASILKRIYEPFFTTKPAGKGTGLGLATVYGIVTQHRGWVEVESEVGKGTTFTVYFPESKRVVTPSFLDTPDNAPRGQETILVVEDDGAVRQVLVRTLKSLGYQVIEAANGHEAIAQWTENRDRISLLITDMIMPEGMTGSELAHRLRAEKPGLGVIISSGYNSEAIGVDYAMQDEICYLPKPYELSQLGDVLRKGLAQKRR